MIRPRPSPVTIGLQHVMVVEPLELEILAATARPTDVVKLVDMILEKRPLASFLDEFRPDLLCMTGYITHVSTILEYAREAGERLPQLRTVLGGVHCEVCPADFNSPHVHFRVVRNAVQAFPALLEHLDGKEPLPPGVLKPGELPEPAKLPAFDFRVPLPDRSVTARYRDRYFYIFHNRVALIKTSFGCPFSCSFCFCHRITGGRYYQRPLDEVMEELENIREQEIYIVDDDFLSNRKRLEEFFSLLKERQIRKHYLVYGRADFIASNPDLIKTFRDLGLRTVIVGMESFSDRELDEYRKNMAPDLNRQAMEVLNPLSVDCYATIILHPDWDRRDFDHMIKNLVSLGVHFVNLQPLTPLPETEMDYSGYELILDRGSYEKWDLAHVAFQPTRMTQQQYYREIVRAYNRILFQPRHLLRYLRAYPPGMLWKMMRGSWMVRRQYHEKIREAAHV